MTTPQAACITPRSVVHRMKCCWPRAGVLTSGDGGHLECGLAPRTNSMPGGNLHAVEKSALKPERPARVRTPTLWQ
jgi:hypothetical protein